MPQESDSGDRVKAYVTAAALIVLAASSSAYAQDESDYSEKEAARVFYDFASCAAKSRPKAARAAVLSQLPNDELIKRYPALVSSDCLEEESVALRLPGDILRYGLADWLVRTDYPTGFPQDLGQVPPLEHRQVLDADYMPKPGKTLKPKELEQLQKRKEAAEAYRIMSIYGECVVRLDVAGAHALILSKAGSAEQKAAFDALQPALAECLPEGTTIAFKPLTLRGTIALNFYRLASAPRTLPAGK
jgi:hypothetical protein